MHTSRNQMFNIVVHQYAIASATEQSDTMRHLKECSSRYRKIIHGSIVHGSISGGTKRFFREKLPDSVLPLGTNLPYK
jgi:hypothetical protein